MSVAPLVPGTGQPPVDTDPQRNHPLGVRGSEAASLPVGPSAKLGGPGEVGGSSRSLWNLASRAYQVARRVEEDPRITGVLRAGPRVASFLVRTGLETPVPTGTTPSCRCGRRPPWRCSSTKCSSPSSATRTCCRGAATTSPPPPIWPAPGSSSLPAGGGRCLEIIGLP
jgi:hypothetical protein